MLFPKQGNYNSFYPHVTCEYIQRGISGEAIAHAAWLCNHHSPWCHWMYYSLFQAIKAHAAGALSGNKWWFTSFPFVSPFSIHSTVTLSLSSFSEVTIAWCIRPVKVSQTRERQCQTRHYEEERQRLQKGTNITKFSW